ncbi:MAG: ABC-2 transporter permease [Bacillota bacterium]|nr:ABC-2 transporter permease [Bacillota bacterium]
MRKLLKKEISLSMHPTAAIFLLLSMMLLIPNYPYYVIFFYTSLAIFFTCLLGRENNDVFFSMMLPIHKKDIVKARISFVVLLELAQIIIAIPFAFLRQSMPVPPNEVGMGANITLFGFSFIMLGVFNLVFFSIYYKDVTKVGVAFNISCIIVSLYITVAETCAHVVPFVKNYLNTNDTQYIPYKLIVLVIGIVIYAALTFVAYNKSVKSFEKLDL